MKRNISNQDNIAPSTFSVNQQHIRNFCIIAHIDHGKSTLADRLLEKTGALDARKVVEQSLDSMELERERGITIKAKAVRMLYAEANGQTYELNLIDTPGHVDFAYEVSRALSACEGVLLVVDASQGIEAQTLTNLYQALNHDLTVIPVINKVDLPSAQPDMVATELENLGFTREEMIYTSAKTGLGTDEVLAAIVERIAPPSGAEAAATRALIFDSHYDLHKGVVAYVRVVEGALTAGQEILLMQSGARSEAMEIGTFRPHPVKEARLATGEVGYVASGLKTLRECQVGDTITAASAAAAQPLPGYQPAKPMVFAGFYTMESEDYEPLRDALDKLKLNDAALTYVPETSPALGFGFRCGCLGLLHLDIVQQRLEREYGLEILTTLPNTEYRAVTTGGKSVAVDTPAQLPDPSDLDRIEEPWVELNLITPSGYIGSIMDLCENRRGAFKALEYLDERRAILKYEVPFAEILTDFYDQLKTRSQGYASMDYTVTGMRPGDLVKLEILVNGQPVDALSSIIPRDRSQQVGRGLVEELRKQIPRQLFEVPLQAAIGGRIISRETIPALRKNVLAKCYGGDVTRKRKLLEKQKAGKKRMKRIGQVEIPQEAFLALLKV